jgi:uncharacterized membrane protein
MTPNAPRSIAQYLAALRAELRGADPALLQDALYDAEEYLRAEVAARPDLAESDVLELIASTYGAPAEVAAAYRQTEATVAAALAAPARPKSSGATGWFFSVYGDSRTWTSLFYALLALPKGVLFFTVAVAGLSLSFGLSVLIIGLPFFLLFIGFTRVLALVEGRIVEGLLGVRMPRRPRPAPDETTLVGRVKQMLTDRRTWTTLLYMLLALPLGVLYFAVSAIALALSVGMLAAPFLYPFTGTGPGQLHVQVMQAPLSPGGAVGLAALGLVLLTLFLHAVRAAGSLHGGLAKRLLVAREGD